MKKIVSLLTLALLIIACNEDIDDTTITIPEVTFNFTHHWDSTFINSTNLETETLTNANGEVITINRIRYLTSHFELTNLAGETYIFEAIS